MKFDFSGQKVIVTGGTRGIGAAITKAFLKSGAEVIATYVSNEQAASEFSKSCEDFKGTLITQKFNASDSEAVKSFWSELDGQWGEVQVLVNNAGIRRDNLLAALRH